MSVADQSFLQVVKPGPSADNKSMGGAGYAPGPTKLNSGNTEKAESTSFSHTFDKQVSQGEKNNTGGSPSSPDSEVSEQFKKAPTSLENTASAINAEGASETLKSTDGVDNWLNFIKASEVEFQELSTDLNKGIVTAAYLDGRAPHPDLFEGVSDAEASKTSFLELREIPMLEANSAVDGQAELTQTDSDLLATVSNGLHANPESEIFSAKNIDDVSAEFLVANPSGANGLSATPNSITNLDVMDGKRLSDSSLVSALYWQRLEAKNSSLGQIVVETRHLSEGEKLNTQIAASSFVSPSSQEGLNLSLGTTEKMSQQQGLSAGLAFTNALKIANEGRGLAENFFSESGLNSLDANSLKLEDANLSKSSPLVFSASNSNVNQLSLASNVEFSNAARASVAVNVQFGNERWSSAVAEQAAKMAAQSIQSAEIQMDPPELGPLTVKIHVQNDQASVTFNSSHAVVRDALEQTMTRLRDMLGEQGMDLVDSGVSDFSHEEQGTNQGDGGDSSHMDEEADSADQTSATNYNLSSGIDYFV